MHQEVRLDLGGEARLNQFSIPVGDYAAARAFYEALGLRLIVDSPEQPYGRFETAGGATLSLHADTPAVYFECDDLDGRIADLRAAGVIPLSGPVDQSWGWREAWFADPSGNRVCLYSAGEYRRFPPWRVGG